MSHHYQYQHQFEGLFVVQYGQTKASAVEDFHIQLKTILLAIQWNHIQLQAIIVCIELLTWQ